MTVPPPIEVDLTELRQAIQAEYAEVALHPTKGFHFHTGRHLARLLGYADAWLEGIPEGAIESFAGTGNPFSLGPLRPGECVVDIGSGAGIDSLIAAHDETLAEVAPWLRMAFAMCAVLAGAGTALASPTILWALMLIAALAALFPVHPFDLIYNHGIRYLRNTGPLPKRRAQSRFACGVGAVWLVATAWAFQSGTLTVGYILGAGLTSVAVLVSTTDICIPSMTYNALFRRS